MSYGQGNLSTVMMEIDMQDKECIARGVRALAERLLSIEGYGDEYTPLHTYCSLKLCESRLGDIMSDLKPDANAVFADIMEGEPAVESWVIPDIGTIKRNKAKGTWGLPATLKAEEEALKKKIAGFKKVAANKKIYYKDGVLDPKTNVLFQFTEAQ